MPKRKMTWQMMYGLHCWTVSDKCDGGHKGCVGFGAAAIFSTQTRVTAVPSDSNTVCNGGTRVCQ